MTICWFYGSEYQKSDCFKIILFFLCHLRILKIYKDYTLNKKYAAFRKKDSDDLEMIKYALFQYILGGKQTVHRYDDVVLNTSLHCRYHIHRVSVQWLTGYDKFLFWVRILLVLYRHVILSLYLNV